MKKPWISFFAVLIIACSFIATRFYYSPLGNGYEMKVTTSDAFGYYMYLPAAIIYNDVKKHHWVAEIEKKYHVVGANQPYQIQQAENGNYICKYLGGVALIQLPFILLAHQVALHSDYPADGFSPPYQWILAFSLAFYAILAIVLLRQVLLRFFSDYITAITLLLIVFATNLIQYISADGAQSHGFIFPLYPIVLYATMRWHEKPSWAWAALAGWIIGLATIARPTEAIMILIPILWATQNKEEAAKKWTLVKANLTHAYIAGFLGFLGVLPQLVYWKYTADTWVYDVGSKWTFLNPFFRVLVGFEKGWFIYTPVTILFIAGMFHLKKYPFRKPLLWFGLLNIYIVISWFDWRYGGSYSTRALSQATGVYALGLAAFLAYVFQTKWKLLVIAILCYLAALNLFQVYQYNLGVIHFNDMNARYYASVYWDADPSPEQASLMDTDEYIADPQQYLATEKYRLEQEIEIFAEHRSRQFFTEMAMDNLDREQENWLRIEANLEVNEGFGNTYLNVIWENGSNVKEQRIRIFRPRVSAGNKNDYAFYFRLPQEDSKGVLKIAIAPDDKVTGRLYDLKVDLLTRKSE